MPNEVPRDRFRWTVKGRSTTGIPLGVLKGLPEVLRSMEFLDRQTATSPPHVFDFPGHSERAEALHQALKECFNMDDDDAAAIAEVVAEQFGSQEEVNDDHLDPEVRSIFYTLEAKKLMTFRREEYSIETGERRRAFFWRLRDEELAARVQHHLDAQQSEESVYDMLPGSAWARNAS